MPVVCRPHRRGNLFHHADDYNIINFLMSPPHQIVALVLSMEEQPNAAHFSGSGKQTYPNYGAGGRNDLRARLAQAAGWRLRSSLWPHGFHRNPQVLSPMNHHRASFFESLVDIEQFLTLRLLRSGLHLKQR